jgi:chorismate mutase
VDDEQQLEALRQRIDGIDGRILELVAERLRTALEIGAIKRRLERPIYDPERERLIVERLIARAPEPLAPEQVRRVFERLIDESRRAELARDAQ